MTQVRATVQYGQQTADLGAWLELAADGEGRLVGSGHPDEAGTLPEFLGVIVSDDGGRTWRVLSRLGQSDLHKIVLKHDRIYAIDAAIGALIVSRDGGRTFSEQFTPSGVLIADFEVDPAIRGGSSPRATPRCFARPTAARHGCASAGGRQAASPGRRPTRCTAR